MGDDDATYYAVFANVTEGTPAETKTQTLQYDTWTYGGSTTDKSSYRLFHSGGYIQSAVFDLSKLSKVVVNGGAFGGASNNKLEIGDGSNKWKEVTLTTSGGLGEDTFTDGTPLSGNGSLYITSKSGTATGSGVRIQRVDIYTLEPTMTYEDYCTTVAADTRDAVNITSFTATNETIVKGGTSTTTVANDQDGWTAAYKYESSDETVATVDASGLISALKKGTATITVTLNVDKNDASYKAGETKTKSVDITVINPSHTATFYVNGEKDSDASVEEEADITFPTVDDVAGFTFMGWTTAAIDGTQATAPATLVNAAAMGAADADYYAVFAKVTDNRITATFDASDLTNTPAVEGETLTWKDTATGITLKLSAGSHYTSGTPNTFTVTKGTSNYFEVTADRKLSSVVTEITATTYKINSVQSGASLATSGTTQTVTFNSDMNSVKCYATSGNQIRAKNIIVNAGEVTSSYYCTTLPLVSIAISQYGYASVSSTQALDFSEIDEITVYVAKQLNGSETVTLTEVESKKVPANTGIIIKGDKGNYNVPVATDAATIDDTNLLVASGEGYTVTAADVDYVYTFGYGTETMAVGFQKAKEGKTVAANRAYLRLTAPAKTDFITWTFDDVVDTPTDETSEVVDGVNHVKTTATDENAPMYNLAGQRVGKDYRGIVIINGKKVVR